MRLARIRPRRQAGPRPADEPEALLPPEPERAAPMVEARSFAPDPAPTFDLGFPHMTLLTVGAELYLIGDSNTDGSARLLIVTDANGDGLPDARLQWRVAGAWVDVTSLNTVPASSVVRSDGLTAQQAFDNLGAGTLPGTQVTAGQVSFSPTGHVSSSNLQAAVAEVDAEKVALVSLDTAGQPPSLDPTGHLRPQQMPALGTFQPGLAAGDTLAWDGAQWVRLPRGADGTLLAADGNQALGLRYISLSGASVQSTYTPKSYSPANGTVDGEFAGIDAAVASLIARVAALETPPTAQLLLANGVDLLLLVDGSSKLLI